MERMVESFKNGMGLWKVIFTVYVFQLILAATVGLQMQQVLDASIGNSLSVEALASGFDYTVITDFINVHGGSFSVLYGQMRWMVLFYMIFASFISAGLLYMIGKSTREYLDFFKGGATYFLRFLILDVLFLIGIVLVLGIALALVGYLFSIAPTDFDNEVVFLRWTLLIMIIAILWTIYLTAWKVRSKLHHIEYGDSLLSSVGSGFGHIWRDKWKTLGYSLVFFLVSILLIYLNHMVGNLPIIIMVIIQQVFLLGKILWRVMYYDVIDQLG